MSEDMQALKARIERLEAENARLKRGNEELTDTLTRVINGEEPWLEPEAKAS
jgi:cell division protein FtsB